MANDLCPVCGANPCYGICPTQDPYQGDQAREAADHDFNARYDDVRERYSGDEIDAAAEEAWDKDHPDDDDVVTSTGMLMPPGDTTGILPDLPLSAFDDDDIPF
jgi:hypothetical protein